MTRACVMLMGFVPLLWMTVDAQTSRGRTDVDLRILTEHGYRRLVAERHGRPLLINLWATWCAPCIEEFPSLVKLDSAFRSRGLDVVTVSIDDPEDRDTKVMPFLRRMKAAGITYINGFTKPNDLIDAIDTMWSGAVPATLLVNERGIKTHVVVGQRSYDEFSRMAQELLSRRRDPR